LNVRRLCLQIEIGIVAEDRFHLNKKPRNELRDQHLASKGKGRLDIMFKILNKSKQNY